jgi:hypothetical protein
MAEEFTEREIEEIINDAEFRSNEISLFIYWISSLIGAGNALSLGLSHGKIQIQDIETLAIKLHGLIHEGRQALKYQFQSEDMLKAIADPNSKPFSEDSEGIREKLLETIGRIESAFSTLEIMSLDFFRNKSCHMFTNNYATRIEPSTMKVHWQKDGVSKNENREKILDVYRSRGPGRVMSDSFEKVRADVSEMLKLLEKQKARRVANPKVTT